MFWLTIFYVIGRGVRPASQQQTFKYKAKLPGIRNRTWGKKMKFNKCKPRLLFAVPLCSSSSSIGSSSSSRHTISTLHQHHPKALHLYHSHSRSLSHSFPSTYLFSIIIKPILLQQVKVHGNGWMVWQRSEKKNRIIFVTRST